MMTGFILNSFFVVVMWIRFNSVEAVISPIMKSMPLIQSGQWACLETCPLVANQWNQLNTPFSQAFTQIPMVGLALYRTQSAGFLKVYVLANDVNSLTIWVMPYAQVPHALTLNWIATTSSNIFISSCQGTQGTQTVSFPSALMPVDQANLKLFTFCMGTDIVTGTKITSSIDFTNTRVSITSSQSGVANVTIILVNTEMASDKQSQFAVKSQTAGPSSNNFYADNTFYTFPLQTGVAQNLIAGASQNYFDSSYMDGGNVFIINNQSQTSTSIDFQVAQQSPTQDVKFLFIQIEAYVCSGTGINATYVGSNCQCSNGYYDNGSNQCLGIRDIKYKIVCDSTCATCTAGANTNCVTCSSSQQRVLTSYNNSCGCMTGRFPTTGVACDGVCYYTCGQCSGTASTSCTYCSAATQRYLQTSNNTCMCNIGFYDISSTNANCTGTKISNIQACDSTCVTCTNSGASSCSSCSSAQHRTFITGNNSCQCNPTYYDNGGTCTACDPTCVDCGGSGPTYCSTCSGPALRTFSTTTQSCPCNPAYYDNSGTCTACSYACTTCTGGTSITCSSPCASSTHRTFIAQNSSCTCSAIGSQGYSDDGHLANCVVCDYTCGTCTSTTSISCTSCSAFQRSLQTSNNTCMCNPGFYDLSSTNADCYACHPSCATCTNSGNTSCSSCSGASHRTFITGNNSCQCNPTYYDNGVNCTVCDPTCVNCVGPGPKSCSSCSSQAFRAHHDDGTCLCYLFYYDNVGTCTRCDPTCQACNGSNATSCTTCFSGFSRIFVSTNNSCHCFPAYYDKAGSCTACDYSCGNCTGTTNLTCSACPYLSNRTLDTVAKSCPCDKGYYDNGTASCSIVCHYSCLTCTAGTSSSCLSCPNSSFRTFIANQCTCNAGYFDDGHSAICGICASPCLNCTSTSSNCSTCIAGRYITPGCLCTSSNQYYDGSSPSCQNCSYKCLTCNQSATNCIICSDLSRGPPPYCNCPIGTGDSNSLIVCTSLRCSAQNPQAQFADSLDQMFIKFNVSVQLTQFPDKGSQTTSQNCLIIFDILTLKTLGQLPACQINNATIVVILGIQATINVGDTMQINPNIINSVGCNATSYSPMKVQQPTKIINPTFDITFTPTVKTCLPNSIALVNIAVTGNRHIQSVYYSIQQITPSNTQTLADLNALLQIANNAQPSQLYVLILPNTLVESTVYQFSVKVTNFLSTNSSVQMIYMTTLSSQSPYIQLIKGGPYKVQDLIILEAQISLTSCDGIRAIGLETVDIQWNIDGINQTVKHISSYFLETVQTTLPPHTFVVGQSIDVKVYATTSKGQANDKTNILMVPSLLITNILGGDKLQGRAQPLVLQSVMLDPDIEDSRSIQDVVLFWTCANTVDGTACNIRDENNKLLVFNNSLKQTIPANSLKVLQSYTFFITASESSGSNQKNITTTISVKVQDTALSSISLLYPARYSTQNVNLNDNLIFIVKKMMAGNRLRRVLVNSQSVSSYTHLTVTMIYNGTQVASFYPQTYVVPIILDQYLKGLYVVGQQSVSLQFKYNDPLQQLLTLESTVVLNFNLPPQAGTMIVNQTVIKALSSSILIELIQWVDIAQPLSYKFGYYTTQELYAQDQADQSQKNMVILNGWSNTNYLQTTLPQGNYNIKTQNYDILLLGFIQNSQGGQAVAQLTLNVQPFTFMQFNKSQYVNDSLSLLSSNLDQEILSQYLYLFYETRAIDQATIEMIVQSTQNILSMQKGGCDQACFGNGVCNTTSQICLCKNGFYWDNCLASQAQYNQTLKISSKILDLIGMVQSKATLKQSTQDQLQKSQTILLSDTNVMKSLNSSQISLPINDTSNALNLDIIAYNNSGGNLNKSVDDLIYQIPNVAQSRQLDSITSSIDSATSVNDVLFSATTADNRVTFNNSKLQDNLNKNLMSMSSNTTDFYSSCQFTDQPAKIYNGTYMTINGQKVSQDAALQYFPNSKYLFAAELDTVLINELDQATMSGSGDIQMSTVTYNTNPYNSDESFPYQDQTNQMVGLNFKDGSGQSIAPLKPLTYKLNTQPKTDQTNQPVQCVSENQGQWISDSCSTLKNIEQTVTGSPPVSCSCNSNTKITVITDVDGLFNSPNIAALADPDLLLNFQFWRSDIFYISLVTFLLWLSFSIVGRKRDIKDLLDLKLKRAALESDEKVPSSNIDDLDAEEKNQDVLQIQESPKISSPKFHRRSPMKPKDFKGEENQSGSLKFQRDKNFLRQFLYCVPLMHELLSIFSIFNQDQSRPVRFTVYYLKMIIMMALISIFGQSLDQVQNIIFSIISVAIITPIIMIVQKGFAPRYDKLFILRSGICFKIIASSTILVAFAGCWYVSLDIAAFQGIAKSNEWTSAYATSLAINIIIVQTVSIMFNIILIPFLSANVHSGDCMMRVLYIALFNEQTFDLIQDSNK